METRPQPSALIPSSSLRVAQNLPKAQPQQAASPTARTPSPSTFLLMTAGPPPLLSLPRGPTAQRPFSFLAVAG